MVESTSKCLGCNEVFKVEWSSCKNQDFGKGLQIGYGHDFADAVGFGLGSINGVLPSQASLGSYMRRAIMCTYLCGYTTSLFLAKGVRGKEVAIRPRQFIVAFDVAHIRAGPTRSPTWHAPPRARQCLI